MYIYMLFYLNYITSAGQLICDYTFSHTRNARLFQRKSAFFFFEVSTIIYNKVLKLKKNKN